MDIMINRISFDPKLDPECSVFYTDVHGYKWRLRETFNHAAPLDIIKVAEPELPDDIREYSEVQGVE